MDFEKVVELYKTVYIKINNNPPKFNKSHEKSVKKFFDFIGNGIGHYHNWWFEFICFQFEYYCEKDTKFGKGKILSNWVFGKQAYERWINKNDEYWLHWVYKFIEKYEIQEPKFNNYITNEEIKDYKNLERKRFFNSDRGFIHCSENNLFDINSNLCKICKYKNICEKVKGIM